MGPQDMTQQEVDQMQRQEQERFGLGGEPYCYRLSCASIPYTVLVPPTRAIGSVSRR